MWWPQTKFGILASVPCPRGALGEYLGAGALLRVGVGLSFDAGDTSFLELGDLVSAKRWEWGMSP